MFTTYLGQAAGREGNKRTHELLRESQKLFCSLTYDHYNFLKIVLNIIKMLSNITRHTYVSIKECAIFWKK
jgi:hypothetical protein